MKGGFEYHFTADKSDLPTPDCAVICFLLGVSFHFGIYNKLELQQVYFCPMILSKSGTHY